MPSTKDVQQLAWTWADGAEPRGDLDRLLGSKEGWRTLRERYGRCTRIHASAGLVAKSLAPRGVWRRIRRAAGGDPLAREFLSLQEAAARGLPVTPPLALRRDADETTMVTAALEAAPLSVGTLVQDTLARGVGALAARLHAAGLLHGDLVRGNILVGAPTSAGVPDLAISDLRHCVAGRNGVPPAARLRARELARLIQSLDAAAPDSLRMLLAAYVVALRPEGGAAVDEERAFATAVEAALVRRRRRVAHHHFRTALRQCAEQRPLQRGRWSGWIRNVLPEEAEAGLAPPAGDLAEVLLDPGPGRILHAGSRRRVTRLDDLPVVVKECAPPRGVPLLRRGRHSGAERAWRGAWLLDAMGLPTPRVWAVATDRHTRSSRLLAEAADPGTTLEQAMAGADEAGRLALAAQAGALARRVHAACLRYHDFNARNLLLHHGSLVLVDTEGVHPGRRTTSTIDRNRMLQVLTDSLPAPTTDADRAALRAAYTRSNT